VTLADSNPTGDSASNNKKENCNIVNLDEYFITNQFSLDYR